jgi:hypothetical protein
MAWWVYKCNSKGLPYQKAWGDWNDLFHGDPSEHWGSSQRISALEKLKKGDMIIAYQTDRNELVGIAQVRQPCDYDSYLYLDPIEIIGVKVRPLRKADSKIHAIPAFKPGLIQTIYKISEADAKRLLKAAGSTYPFGTKPAVTTDDDVSIETRFLEGEKRASVTTTRNSELRAAAKKKWGLKCYCCGFDFEQFYGGIAKGAGIVHHLQPFTDSEEGQRKSTVEDVRVVCPNCHYVLHLENPPMSVDELKQLISKSWLHWSEDGVLRRN